MKIRCVSIMSVPGLVMPMLSDKNQLTGRALVALVRIWFLAACATEREIIGLSAFMIIGFVWIEKSCFSWKLDIVAQVWFVR